MPGLHVFPAQERLDARFHGRQTREHLGMLEGDAQGTHTAHGDPHEQISFRIRAGVVSLL